ncbi:flagellar hook-associated protein FlgK [Halopseudomonas bauzanensis]|uniref:flagellar hook-associated protein FlgK n=1 Tax=Halopseudomonas bauzanensis TaxID=653930 RepID=UPI002553CD81|nr:flagellar hook-associated protein FlgK [Halopseudomonas bauzanensis]
MADLFNIGLSGLRAAQTNLSVTGQNITNVNTPGYSRQTAIQSANPPGYTGAGYMGTGTKVVDVQRIYNQFLTNQVRSTTSAAAANQAYNVQIEELNSTLSSTASGITTGLQNYFAALQTAIEDPASLPARQLFLSEAQGLAGRFNSVHQQLATQNQFLNQQMTTVAEQVSRLAVSVAGYNDAISKAAANGAAPNDLLDARDEAIRQLSEYVGVTVVNQDDNSINLFIGSGQPLVVGKEASLLRATPGLSDPARLDLQLVSGNSAQDVSDLISGGELGGLLRYRDDVLDQAFNALGRMSLAIASEFNQQQGKGLDLNGQVGSDLFGDINSDAYLELRSRGRESNRSDATLDVRITDTSALSTSDYELTFTSDTEFTVRRVGDGRVLGPFDLNASEGDPRYAAFDGLDLSGQSGNYLTGDRYLLTPTRSAAQNLSVVMTEPQQLAFAAPLSGEAGLQNRGTGSVTQPTLTDGPQSLELARLKGLGVEFTYTETGTGTGRLTSDDPALAIDVTLGQPFSWEVDGHQFSMTLSGKPLDGDSFSVEFNTGVADNRNALAMAELQTKQVLGQGEGARGFSLLDGYGDLVQRVATFTAQSRTETEANMAMLTQATNNRNSVSAVNLDEEAANLIQFEQYYNASAQIIQVARTVFDTLINSIR